MALVTALDRAGWGDIAGHDFRGVRGTLFALCRVVENKSGQGKATAWQIAERAGYSERWTRRCLAVLEELQLIEWHRGGVVEGKPVPSWFRVSKRALLLLVAAARKVATERRSAQEQATRGRISKYRLTRTRGHQTRRSDHAELRTALLSIEEGPRPEEPPVERPLTDEQALSDAVARCRAGLRQKRADRPARAQVSKAATTMESARKVPARLAERLHAYANPTVGTDK